jgi:hypothetical protein
VTPTDPTALAGFATVLDRDRDRRHLSPGTSGVGGSGSGVVGGVTAQSRITVGRETTKPRNRETTKPRNELDDEFFSSFRFVVSRHRQAVNTISSYGSSNSYTPDLATANRSRRCATPPSASAQSFG